MADRLQVIVGHNLRAYRKAHGLSQEAFAERLGFHRTYMGGIERGERNLSLQGVESLAARLDVDPVSLLVDHERVTQGGQSRGRGQAS